jgi:cystathionine gamma-synthase
MQHKNIETIAVHAGNKTDPTTGAVIQPITLSTTFERDADGGYASGYQYTRGNNPNRASLEECLAALEGGESAACFASGNAAAAAVFQSLKAGDHIIVPDDMYHGISFLLKDIFSAWNLEFTFVDMCDAAAVKAAIKANTKLIWMETPSNPLMKITDIKQIADIAKSIHAISVCDNTFATPILQSPLQLGCDLVMHATTKYLGGHSDVLGGAIVSKHNDDFFQRIKNVQKLSGAVPAPFDCFLTLRGIRTLPYRMKGHCENAMKIAQFLNAHPEVEKVYYPGLATDAGYTLASKQMKNFGGMLSFCVKGGEAKARKVANSVKIFTQATSLGGAESLIEHRASVEGPDTKTPANLLRISVGLEHADDLIADLTEALK